MRAALRDAARVLNVSPFDVPQRVEALLADVQQLRPRLATVKQSGQLSAESLLRASTTVGETGVMVAEAPGANPNLMRQLIDQVRKKSNSAAILLATVAGEDKVVLVAGITRDLMDKGLSAGEWVRQVAPVVGGGGGGKPDMAQAGGKQPEKIGDALEKARQVMHDWLQKSTLAKPVSSWIV